MTAFPLAAGDPASRRHIAASLTCADIVDALGRRHRHRAHLRDLTSPTPGRILFGQAITISYFPSCSTGVDPATHTFGVLFEQAIGTDGAEKVLVLASNGYAETSVGGGDDNGAAGASPTCGAADRCSATRLHRTQPILVRSLLLRGNGAMGRRRDYSVSGQRPSSASRRCRRSPRPVRFRRRFRRCRDSRGGDRRRAFRCTRDSGPRCPYS